MDDKVEVTLRTGAMELRSLDDDAVLRELGLEFVRHLRCGARYRMTRANAIRLLDTFRFSCGKGWDHEHPGAASRAASGAIRAIEKALATSRDAKP